MNGRWQRPKDLRGDIKALRGEMAGGFRMVNEALHAHGGRIAVLEERTSLLIGR
jgi:hypothetical protein